MKMNKCKMIMVIIFYAVFLSIPCSAWYLPGWDAMLKANRLDIDNIRIDGNTISSTNTNGDINLTPNGSGDIVFGGTMDIYDYETFYITSANDGSVPPAALSTITDGNQTVWIRNFASDQTEDVIFDWEVPPDIKASSGIWYRVGMYVTHGTGPSNEGISWQLQGMCIGNGDSLGAMYGANVTSEITGRTDAQYDKVYSAWSDKVTITDLAASENAHLHLQRDHDDSDDDYGQDMGGYCLQIKFVRSLDGA